MPESEERKALTVETLKAPPVEVQPAPLVTRVFAGFIDAGIVLVIAVVLTVIAGFQFTVFSLGAAQAVFLAGLSFAYFLLLEGLFAATIGKVLLRLRVVDKDGDPCTFKASFSRNLLRFVDWLPLLYIAGIISILASAKRQRIGDRVAGTVVARIRAKDINPPPAPFLYH